MAIESLIPTREEMRAEELRALRRPAPSAVASEPTRPLEAFLVALVGVGGAVILGYLVVLGFLGGTVPVLGKQLSGGLLSGLSWMLWMGLVPAVLLAAALVVTSLREPRRPIPAPIRLRHPAVLPVPTRRAS